jgi:hypothetical protein
MQNKRTPEATGFVDEGTLLTLCPDVPELQRQDLLSSTLFGQLAASKLFSRKVQPMEWYKKYFETLGTVGWRFDTSALEPLRPQSEMFTIEEIVMGLLKQKTSEGEYALAQETMHSLRDLPDADPRVIVFNDSTHSEYSVNIQVGVQRAEAMVNVGVVFTTSQELKSVFHEKLETKRLKDGIRAIVQVATLDEEVYSQVRESVVKKLGAKREELILELDL